MANSYKRLIYIVIIVAILSYLFLDKSLALYFLNDPLHLKSLFWIITLYGDSKYSLISTAIIAIIFFKCSKPIFKGAIYIFSSVALSGILTDIIKVIVARYRPPMFIKEHLYGFNWFDFGHMVNSFPSGHSTTAFALSVSLAMLFPKYKKILLIIATLTAFSRVVVGVHYFSDVLIGSLIGTLTAYYLYKYFYKETI